MKLTKEQVIEELCNLATRVSGEKFNHTLPHDCFCGENKFSENDFQFDSEVLDFIIKCVEENLWLNWKYSSQYVLV